MDFSDYRPAPHVLDHVKTVDFVAVVGPSAVGKTTLMTRAQTQDPSVKMILTQSSRKLRPGERDGVDIHIRSKEEMLARIAKHEYVQVPPSLLGDIYATGPEDYPSEGIGTLAVLADAIPTFRALPFRSFRIVFVVPPSWERWQEQLKSHSFDTDRLAKRLVEAKHSFNFALNNQDVQFVVSDDLSTATADFIVLAKGEPLSPRLQADQQRAKEIIASLLHKL